MRVVNSGAMSESGEGLREAKAKSARRRAAPWLFGGLVLLLLSVLVALQVFGLWEIFTPDTASDTLLIYALSTLNFVAFFLFTSSSSEAFSSSGESGASGRSAPR